MKNILRKVTPVLSIDYISRVANSLSYKYQTRDPYQLCDSLGVRIRLKDLGTDIKAFYFYQSRIRNIVLNYRVTEDLRRVLVAHELGHDRLHKKIAILKDLREIAFCDLAQPMEYEANLFAAELLIDDKELLALLNQYDQSFFNIAAELYVPAALLDFKLRVLKHKGYNIKAPYIANGDFLKNDMRGYYTEETY